MIQSLNTTQRLSPPLDALDYLGRPFTATAVDWRVTRHDDGTVTASVTISSDLTATEGARNTWGFAKDGQWPDHLPIPPDWFIDATCEFIAETAPAKAAA